MKIYFTASISGGTEELRKNYDLIIETLKNLGHSVMVDHFMNKTIDDLHKQTREEALAIQKSMSRRKRQADIVLFEVSAPSLGVGQELDYALRENKQVIALYIPGRKPHVLFDEGADHLLLAEYTPRNLKEVLRDAIEESQDRMDVRFNFFIPQSIVRYLDWISKNRKLPRAVFLRRLIEHEMEADKEYQDSLG
jgi:2'-deoxynucleoside 5'-phosphate N-hydrolase